MKIVHDFYGRNEPSKIYLATPTKRILCALNGVDVDAVDFSGKCNDLSPISFDINRYVEDSKGNKIESNGYELVSKYMRLYVTNIGWFIMDTPEIHSTGNTEYKTINASSAEIEYRQIPLDMWKVNKGTTDSLEMLVDGNVEEINGVEFAKENIKFHNPKNKQLSLVDILVSKVDGWEVGYIDPIPKVYESFENGELVKTSVPLADEVGMFEVDYSNCYAFMMQDFEKFFNCVVEFDYMNFKVNFYRVENFGKDTNVVIGYRNVENSSDVTVDEDNIFTKFRVAGGNNLGIEQFNGGSNYLIYLDNYWLNQKYLSESTINKYNKWSTFCSAARYQYGNYSRQWNTLQEEIGELNTRVPTSDCNPENWQNLSDDELLNFKSDYEAQKLGYEKIYVDEDGNFDIDALNASPDANIYHQIVDTILPNIDIEIENRKLPTSEGEKDFIEIYETAWEYYGVNELEIRLLSYQDVVNLLKKSHYDLTWERYQELSKQDIKNYPVLTKDGFEDKHNEYLENAYQLDENNMDSCAAALKDRKAEVAQKESEQKEIGDNRNSLAQKMNLESWKGQVNLSSPESEGFTDKELNEIYHIINQTTYTNENIFTTSLDDLKGNVDVQQKLCETALDDIAVYSVPQTIYTTSLDNILSASGNELHAHDLNYGNFVRLGIRDDYYVKLRVMGISFNPCLYENQFSLQFSNMIKSGKKRNDFVSLLDMAGNLSNSSAQNSYSGNSQLSDENIYQILSKILQSSQFSNKVNNIVNGGSNSSGGFLKPGDIYGNNGFFEYIQAELIAANKIVANSGEFKDLSALVARIDDLLAGNVSAELGHIIELTAENVKISEAVIKDLIAAQITVSMLKAGDISADSFHIVSDDGGLEIAGNTMQFKDANGVVRIQIGRDANNEFTFCLYDETGKGVLIDSTGIKESAIKDGLIVNDMIKPGTIGKDRLSFNIVETDENGKVDWGNITANGQGLDVEFGTIKNEISKIEQEIEGISNQSLVAHLDREMVLINCDKNGLVLESELIEIHFSVYKGLEKVPATAQIGVLPSGITLGESIPSTDSIDGTIILNVTKGANLNNVNSGSINIKFIHEDREISKSFSWGKLSGSQGEAARTFILESNVTTVVKDDNDKFIPSQVIFSSFYRDGKETERLTYSGRFIIQESTNGILFENKYVSIADEDSCTYVFDNPDIKIIKCEMFASGGIEQLLDIKSVSVLSDISTETIEEINKQISGVSQKVDAVEKSITNKVWQSDIDNKINTYDGETIKILRDQITEQKIEIGKISSTVFDVQTTLEKKADGTEVQKLEERVSKAEQDAEGFKQTVESTYISKYDKIGARNLIRNSRTLIFEDYKFINDDNTYLVDENYYNLVDENDNFLVLER